MHVAASIVAQELFDRWWCANLSWDVATTHQEMSRRFRHCVAVSSSRVAIWLPRCFDLT